MSRTICGLVLGGLALSLTVGSAIRAEDKAKDFADTYEQTVAEGIAYLRGAQAEDGSWSKSAGPAITGLAVTGLLRHGRGVNDPAVAKALDYLEKFVQPNGGVYHPNSTHRNYETAIAALAFKEANVDGRYDKRLKGAEAFLKGLQWDEGEDKDKSSFYYGGAGYGGHKRPDLSNTTFLLDALKATGVPEDDPAMQKALFFVSRCQNLETEHNTTPFASKENDGGFYYTPAEGGRSQAHEGLLPNGGLRSYGSMTYAGLKSMIYAGVGPEDPRVKAATEWIARNYELESNPGLGAAGLYYYYHTFAKALDALGQDTFVDAEGKRHNWRAELTAELAERQQPNGSWINEANERWLEGEANLVTSYALLALSHAAPE